MEIKRDVARMPRSVPAVDGCRKDGMPIAGIEQVLLDVRADRIRWFRQEDGQEEQVVFVS
ncbi:hypothetical protein [Caballeronia sp. Lep1P3]|uniref:hypothetical protein n=1 Tax=Caballeronia sp. Lep1P3 TaxID=2878150 RepID=UPI001FD50E57|nr:hypothetical protein [Caballeronia sp. Lep1P3]